jgi:hypothetical protein
VHKLHCSRLRLNSTPTRAQLVEKLKINVQPALVALKSSSSSSAALRRAGYPALLHSRQPSIYRRKLPNLSVLQHSSAARVTVATLPSAACGLPSQKPRQHINTCWLPGKRTFQPALVALKSSRSSSGDGRSGVVG